MAKGLITHAYLENTADAIRVLRGESDTYTPDEFGEKILDAIPTEEVTDSIVSVTDAAAYPVEGLEFAIEPVQDLHGYDKPWPGGGGKNLLPTFDTAPTEEGLTITVDNGAITINGMVSTTTTIKAPMGDWKWDGTVDCWLSGCPTGGSATGGYSVRVSDAEISSGFSKYDTGNGVKLQEYGGSSTTIINRPLCFEIVLRSGTYTNKTFRPMLNYGLSAELYEPYANICPISGWTGIDGQQCGKNLLQVTADSRTVNGITFTVNNDGTITANGTCINGLWIKIAETTLSGNYIANGCPVDGSNTKYFLSVGAVQETGQGVNLTLDGTSKNVYIFIAEGQTVSNQIWKPMIRRSTEADPTFEPYQDTSIPITFPTEAGTVYGGKVDVVNGKLRVDRAEVDLGDLDWSKSSLDKSIFLSSPLPNTKPTQRVVDVNDKSKICSNYKYIGIRYENSLNNGEFITSLSAGTIRIQDDNYTDAANFQTAMQGVKLVYELATPIEYDLTPQQLTMLLGDNNVWCDTGKTTLEYKVDLGRFIAKLQAAQATPQLSLSRQAVSLDAAGEETAQNEDEGAEER